MRKLLATLAVIGAATAVVAGCGNDNGDGNGDAVEADNDATGPADVTLTLEDFQFAPDTLEGTAGETVTIELENTGDTSHTFTGDGVDETVVAGDSATVEVDLPDTGDYEFFCRFHRSQGMTGAITTGGATPGGGGGEPAPESEPSGGIPGY